MEFRPGFFGRLFTGSGDWTISIAKNSLTWQSSATSSKSFALPTFEGIDIRDGIFWSKVRLELAGTTILLLGISKQKSKQLQRLLHQAALVANAIGNLKEFYAQPKYLANRDVIVWSKTLSSETHHLRKRFADLSHPPIDKPLQRELEKDVQRLQDILTGKREELALRNKLFVAQEIKRLNPFFDSIESQPMTEEQQRAAIVLEDNNLLIASAGSGKSSTLVAKIAYALETGIYKSSEILVLAFNKKATEELNTRLAELLSRQLKEQEQIKTKTFHGLGVNIIASVEGKVPALAPWANETRDNEGKVIEEIVENLALSDRHFLGKWVLFKAICFRENRELPRFASTQEYDAYLRQVGEEQAGRRGIRSLNGELVKSMEEIAIANWLFMNGIPYEYERSYEYETADKQYRQYHPDFYFPDINCYHEHFALDDKGNAPAIFKGKYEEGVRWKRMLHAEKKTDLIETTSAMYRSGSLFGQLKTELINRGQQFHPKSAEEVLEWLNKLKISSNGNFIRTFITLYKSGGHSQTDLQKNAKSQRDRFRALAFLDVVMPIFQAYQAKLASLVQIDFEDMIRTAAKYIRERQFVHHYSLILVDELQDIAHGRAELVRAMLGQNLDSRLFAVGDDWQSIYRFTGSDIGIMVNFPKSFGVTEANYLTQTFRSNQGITDVAATFIQANPKQLKKAVQAVDKTKDETIQILAYGMVEDSDKLISAEMDALADNARKEKRILRVFLLGRYNRLRPKPLPSWQKRHSGALEIQFLTIHRSKGLESDFVFLLGVNSGVYSFPSEIENDPLINLVLPDLEAQEHAEERRLFYVALTRGKRRAYILTRKSRFSKFVLELLNPTSQGIVIYRDGGRKWTYPDIQSCPACKVGVIRISNSSSGPIWSCSQCDYKKKAAPGTSIPVAIAPPDQTVIDQIPVPEKQTRPPDNEGIDALNASPLALNEAAKAALNLIIRIERPASFRQLGWFYVGLTKATCPKCDTALEGFRKPYISARQTYHHWGLICHRCRNAFEPNQLAKEIREALYKDSTLKPGPKPDKAASIVKANPTPLAADSKLYELLKAKRSELAHRDGVPAFCVFKDRSLHEIAVNKPISKAALLKIHGIGKVLADRYGEEVLQIVRNHRKDE